MSSANRGVVGAILAGGRASRMWPYSLRVPKPLVSAGGRVLLSYAFECLARSGITESFLLYRDQAVLDYARTEGCRGLSIRPILDEGQPGTAAALRLLPLAPDVHTIVVMTGDMIQQVDVRDALVVHERAGNVLTLAVAGVPAGVWDGDVVTVRDDGSITSYAQIGEPRHGEVLGSVGIQVISVAALAEGIPEGAEHMSDFIRHLVLTGSRVGVWRTDALPWDCSSLAEVGEGNRLLLERQFPFEAGRYHHSSAKLIDPTAYVSSDAVVIEPVRIGRGSAVMQGAVVRGPTTLGDGVVVGAGAILESCTVFDGTRVPDGFVVSGGVIDGGRLGHGELNEAGWPPSEVQLSTVLAGYASGCYPQDDDPLGPLNWYERESRGIVQVQEFRESPSVARHLRKHAYVRTINQSFEEVVEWCAEPRTYGSPWLSGRLKEMYLALFRSGFARSYELWRDDALEAAWLCVTLGRACFAESGQHRSSGSGVAAADFMLRELRSEGFVLCDLQRLPEHMLRFGAKLISRSEYLAELSSALRPMDVSIRPNAVT